MRFKRSSESYSSKKIPRTYVHVGSSPTPGTKQGGDSMFYVEWKFFHLGSWRTVKKPAKSYYNAFEILQSSPEWADARVIQIWSDGSKTVHASKKREHY